MAISSFYGGRLADRYGRKKMLLVLSVLFFFGAMGCTFSPSAKIMIVCRFFLGLAVGGAATTVPIYLAELAPAERRGRMVTQGEQVKLCSMYDTLLVSVKLAKKYKIRMNLVPAKLIITPFFY